MKREEQRETEILVFLYHGFATRPCTVEVNGLLSVLLKAKCFFPSYFEKMTSEILNIEVSFQEQCHSDFGQPTNLVFKAFIKDYLFSRKFSRKWPVCVCVRVRACEFVYERDNSPLQSWGCSACEHCGYAGQCSAL